MVGCVLVERAGSPDKSSEMLKKNSVKSGLLENRERVRVERGKFAATAAESEEQRWRTRRKPKQTGILSVEEEEDRRFALGFSPPPFLWWTGFGTVGFTHR